MKVSVVICTAGLYDCERTWVESVWSTREKAEAHLIYELHAEGPNMVDCWTAPCPDDFIGSDGTMIVEIEEQEVR